jgi:hypothetical protein
VGLDRHACRFRVLGSGLYRRKRVEGKARLLGPAPAPELVSVGTDAGANQLVIPMNANNALAFVPLE